MTTPPFVLRTRDKLLAKYPAEFTDISPAIPENISRRATRSAT
jgi:hypothetical protein